jgi:hypothetical protein
MQTLEFPRRTGSMRARPTQRCQVAKVVRLQTHLASLTWISMVENPVWDRWSEDMNTGDGRAEPNDQWRMPQ